MQKQKIMGGIIGVVVGDALGLPVQFASRELRRQRPVTGMEGWGSFKLPPGYWSDDSSLTLCLVESICRHEIDPADAGARFLKWYEDGYWTPTGYAFDVGNATTEAMERMRTGIPAEKAGPNNETDNGNGALMRILPAAIYLAEEDDTTMAAGIHLMSGITHGHLRSKVACCLYTMMVRELLAGATPQQAYRSLCHTQELTKLPGMVPGELQHFTRILSGKIDELPEAEINSDGYVIHTLEAALWCLLRNDNYQDTVLEAVNLGWDTDTTAAVVGGLAGIAYGLGGIPAEWIQFLPRQEEILELAEEFADKVINHKNSSPI